MTVLFYKYFVFFKNMHNFIFFFRRLFTNTIDTYFCIEIVEACGNVNKESLSFALCSNVRREKSKEATEEEDLSQIGAKF